MKKINIVILNILSILLIVIGYFLFRNLGYTKQDISPTNNITTNNSSSFENHITTNDSSSVTINQGEQIIISSDSSNVFNSNQKTVVYETKSNPVWQIVSAIIAFIGICINIYINFLRPKK